MAGPLIRSLWFSTRTSLSSSSSLSTPSLKPYLYARAAAITRAFSTAPAASASSSPELDPSRLRNVAVIGHVGHGKTTLMDQLLRQYGADVPHERALDSISLQRERGISSKVTSISWNEYELNMVDTPGHADFGGEVERVAGMVEGAIFVADGGEDLLAQTEFLLDRVLKYNVRPLLLLNKVDKRSVTVWKCDNVACQVYDLFDNLGATEKQLDFPVFYASAKQGWASSTYTKEPPDDEKNMLQLLDAIIRRVPPPTANLDAPFKMLVSMMERDFYLGRILTGRIDSGVVRVGDKIHGIRGTDGGVVKIEEGKITKLMKKKGTSLVFVDYAGAGDIISMSGLGSPSIGDTVSSVEAMTPMPTVELDPPTISMTFGVNDSPLAGKDGTHIRSARDMYKDVCKVNFSMEHCWKMLRYLPKWNTEFATKKPKARKEIPTSSSPPECVMTENSEYERPIGRKAAIEMQKKRKRSGTEYDDDGAAILQQMRADQLEYRKQKSEYLKEMIQLAKEKDEREKRREAKEQDEADAKIMAMDTSSMGPIENEYFNSRKQEIIERRRAHFSR